MGGGGCQKFRKIADVVYGWSLIRRQKKLRLFFCWKIPKSSHFRIHFVVKCSRNLLGRRKRAVKLGVFTLFFCKCFLVLWYCSLFGWRFRAQTDIWFSRFPKPISSKQKKKKNYLKIEKCFFLVYININFTATCFLVA